MNFAIQPVSEKTRFQISQCHPADKMPQQAVCFCALLDKCHCFVNGNNQRRLESTNMNTGLMFTEKKQPGESQLSRWDSACLYNSSILIIRENTYSRPYPQKRSSRKQPSYQGLLCHSCERRNLLCHSRIIRHRYAHQVSGHRVLMLPPVDAPVGPVLLRYQHPVSGSPVPRRHR